MTEQEFKKLCDEVYRDRYEIYPLNPNVSRREALLWMLLGSLVSLLSVPLLEQPGVYGDRTSDPYGEAITELLQKHASPAFDVKVYLAELSEKLEAEAETRP